MLPFEREFTEINFLLTEERVGVILFMIIIAPKGSLSMLNVLYPRSDSTIKPSFMGNRVSYSIPTSRSPPYFGKRLSLNAEQITD
jgi:hypothetical protein